MDQLTYLITYLLEERKEKITIPSSVEEKKKLYKTLCNIREPKAISEEYLQVEKAYLQEELKNKGVVNSDQIPTVKEQNSSISYGDHICLWRGDITRLKVDAIVNPANSEGLGCFNPEHQCLDNKIGMGAGVALRLECNEVMKKKNYFLAPGEAMITKGYQLPAQFVIHTVGPMITGYVTEKDKEQLENCYINCLKLAHKKGIRTIAFPCISTGLFHFPKELASKIATSSVMHVLEKHFQCFDKIIFCVFDQEDYEWYRKYLQIPCIQKEE